MRIALASVMALLALTSVRVASAPASQRVSTGAVRVCADPNNLPFSNRQGEGFENRLASLLARDLGAPLEYTWWPQRRGFVRNTLDAGNCDVVMGVPAHLKGVDTTRAYYRVPDVRRPSHVQRTRLAAERSLACGAEEVRLQLERREPDGPVREMGVAAVAGGRVGERDDAAGVQEAVRGEQVGANRQLGAATRPHRPG